MAKNSRQTPYEPENDEPEDKAPKGKASKEAADEVNEASQLEPYPTGNPPDPMEEYYKAHPERKLAADAAAAAEKEAAKAPKEPEKKEKK